MITREKALEEVWTDARMSTLQKVETDYIIKAIYDSYEESTCLNCTHFKDTECTVIPDWNCYDDCPANWTPPVGFGCNLFTGEPDES